MTLTGIELFDHDTARGAVLHCIGKVCGVEEKFTIKLSKANTLIDSLKAVIYHHFPALKGRLMFVKMYDGLLFYSRRHEKVGVRVSKFASTSRMQEKAKSILKAMSEIVVSSMEDGPITSRLPGRRHKCYTCFMLREEISIMNIRNVRGGTFEMECPSCKNVEMVKNHIDEPATTPHEMRGVLVSIEYIDNTSIKLHATVKHTSEEAITDLFHGRSFKILV